MMNGNPVLRLIRSCELHRASDPVQETEPESTLEVSPLTLPYGHFWQVHVSPGFILRWEHSDNRGGLLVFDMEELQEVRGEQRAAFGFDLLEIDKLIEALRLWQAHYTAAVAARKEV